MTEMSPHEQDAVSILIVDDVPQNIQVLVNIFKEKNFKISVAADGAKALKIVREVAPDLILLDIMMPGMDGFQVCEQLKASDETKNIPVIFLTARTDTRDIVKGFELGAVDYVTKPFNKAELLARVHTHLELRKAQREIITLEQKNAALAMAVTANHEINQPLTVLQGNLEIYLTSIDRENLNPKQQKCLAKIEHSIEKIQVLLEKFSRSDSIYFEEYLGHKKMVVFGNEGDGNAGN
ncbi:MAG: response regulator [bacterium]|nr:response regulator [bacterium]